MKWYSINVEDVNMPLLGQKFGCINKSVGYYKKPRKNCSVMYPLLYDSERENYVFVVLYTSFPCSQVRFKKGTKIFYYD